MSGRSRARSWSRQVVLDVAAAGVNFPGCAHCAGSVSIQASVSLFARWGSCGNRCLDWRGVTNLAVGDRVIAAPGWGGFAEQLLVPDARTCIPIPDGMDMATAAAFVMTYGTSYHALVDRADPKPGEKLLVLGAAGGVGLAAVEIGKALGLKSPRPRPRMRSWLSAPNTGRPHDQLLNERPEGRRQADLGWRLRHCVRPGGRRLYRASAAGHGWKGACSWLGLPPATFRRSRSTSRCSKGCDIRGIFWGSFVAETREPTWPTSRALMGMLRRLRSNPISALAMT